jgi:uncharacterized protein YlxW (UPF0749 family)
MFLFFFRILIILLCGQLAASIAALAQPTSPSPDSAEVQALKVELMDSIQKELNTMTAYKALQAQIGHLQATIQTDEAELAKLKVTQAPPEHPGPPGPPGTVAGGDAGHPK